MQENGLGKGRAKASFGDDRVFIEKFIVDPRHIEIQVLGDKHGNVIYLGERECSIQRRNQKVIEEAPSPLLDEATRRKMGKQAVALAKAVNYDSAGTVEFVAGQDKSFYFLEMNTRLQVEHPVTELVYRHRSRRADDPHRCRREAQAFAKGRDADRVGGRSRVYAEIPSAISCPRSDGWSITAESSVQGITVRNDTGVQEGGEISIYYDPMIAKLVTHAPSRAAAIPAQWMALNSFYIDGIRHNIPFLSALINHPRWREGRLSTGFISEEFTHGFTVRAPEGEVARTLAAVAAAVDHVLGERKRRISGQLIHIPVYRERRRAVWLGREEILLEILRETNGLAVRFVLSDGALGPARHLVSSWKPGDPVWQGTIEGQFVAVQVRRLLNGFQLAHQGFDVRGSGLHGSRGDRGAIDAGDRRVGYRQEGLVSHARTGGIDCSERGPGGQGGRDACRG